MSRTRHKLDLKKVARDLNVFASDIDIEAFGDDVKASKTESVLKNLGLALQAGTEGAQQISSIVQAQQDAGTAKKKAQDLDIARRAVVDAKAQIAKADVIEKDPNGPLHKDAQKQLIDAQAQLEKLSSGVLDDLAAKKAAQTKHASATPSWVWYAVGAAGAFGIGLVGYKLITGKKGRR